VEPRAGYGVLRLRQQFGRNQSTAGIMLTGVRRDIADGSPLTTILARDAWAAATDWNLRFQGGRYQLSAYAGWTLVRGAAAAITRLQRAPARYYQRPDADHLRFDSTRTALPGYVYGARFEKAGGRHWTWSLFAEVETEGHERNDIGRLTTADNFDTSVNLRYREQEPGRTFYSWNVSLSVQNNWNTGWVKQRTGAGIDLSATFRNYWNVSFDVNISDRVLNDRLTRGGPLMGQPREWSVRANLGSNSRLTTTADLDAEYHADEAGGWGYEVGLEISARPSESLSLSFEPEWSRARDTRQFVDSRDGGRAATFGRRYIFGTIDHTTLAADIRASYVVSPDLTLELYAQPFVSRGRYTALGELPGARSHALRYYGTDGTTAARETDGSWSISDGADQFTLENPDFHVGSLRSNLVLRWEWRRGSTLYLVWQQDRGLDLPLASRAAPGGWWDALTAPGDNFIAAKISYWFPVS
jgi:hypothetical protein